MSVLWFLLLAVIATFFLLRTTTGNWVFSIGQNAQAARNLGVPVARTTRAALLDLRASRRRSPA